MTIYAYSSRRPGSCKAKVPTRGVDSAQTLNNAIALYQRPVQVHSGPTPMRQGEGLDAPYPWPWVRLDTAAGVPTRLDEATFYPRVSRGTLDVSMRLVGLYQAADLGGDPVENSDDPTSRISLVPCLVTVELCQYVSGTTPTVIATSTTPQTIVFYPNFKVPWYPLLSHLSIGVDDSLSPDFNLYMANSGGGGVLRAGQFYPPDLAILQRVLVSLDFEEADWAPDFTTAADRPVFVRVTCVADPAGGAQLDPLSDGDFTYFRVFNVASEMRVRGRI